jgi:hypothetical protein
VIFFKYSLLSLLFVVIALAMTHPVSHAQTATKSTPTPIKSGPTPQPAKQETKNSCLWEICSVDTMKISRDRARENEANPTFDTEIKREMQMIKATGAQYVALGTPYDEEFIPYLKRWVTIARSEGLHVWFRGNWSGWEGWFDYPKTMTPKEHLQKTAIFIKTHAELFQNGDIFDACPECEGSNKWPQNLMDQEYRDFIKEQRATNSAAFAAIGKDVRTDIPTMIGGHAKDVLDQETIDALDHHVAIDHYVKDLATMQEYINYFRDTFQSKVMISEFGAPVPDLNGNMNEDEQAAFVESILSELYKQKDTVMGLNYFVLNDGSTTLTNDDGSKRKVYETLRSYFSPQTIKGTVTNTLGDPLKDIAVVSSESATQTKTDTKGQYILTIPAKDQTLSTTSTTYTSTSSAITVNKNREVITKDFVVKPLYPDAIYQIREFLQKVRLERAKTRTHIK